MRLALCQLNATVGDIDGNAERIRAGLDAARDGRSRSRAVPESSRSPAIRPRICCCASTSWPMRGPRSRSWRPRHTAWSPSWDFPSAREDVYNAAAVLADGAVHAIYRKVHLPNYGVFDEHRYFRSGPAGRGAAARRAISSV